VKFLFLIKRGTRNIFSFLALFLLGGTRFNLLARAELFNLLDKKFTFVSFFSLFPLRSAARAITQAEFLRNLLAAGALAGIISGR
jgi:hypothetical protein